MKKPIKILFISWFVIILISTITLFITSPGNAEFINNCKDIDSSNDQNQLECWENLIQNTLDRKGLGSALSLLAELYSTQPLFAKNCHEYTHIIGQKAYDNFKNHENIELTPQTVYCGYGFYHGFMEQLLTKGGEIEEARQFCKKADEKLSGKIKNSSLACFHGIGHGNVDIHDEKKWGNAQALIDPALRLCDQIAVTTDEIYRCSSGVFNSISILQSSNKYGLSINKQDPLGICSRQLDKYQESCYTNMMVVLMSMTKNKFPEAVKFVEAIKDEKYALASIKTLSSLNARERIHEDNYSSPIEDCRKLQERLQLNCILGFAEGLIEFGEPAKEYIKAIKYCNTDLLSDTENKACQKRIMIYSNSIYEPEKAMMICKQIWGNEFGKCKN